MKIKSERNRVSKPGAWSTINVISQTIGTCFSTSGQGCHPRFTDNHLTMYTMVITANCNSTKRTEWERTAHHVSSTVHTPASRQHAMLAKTCYDAARQSANASPQGYLPKMRETNVVMCMALHRPVRPCSIHQSVNAVPAVNIVYSVV